MNFLVKLLKSAVYLIYDSARTLPQQNVLMIHEKTHQINPNSVATAVDDLSGRCLLLRLGFGETLPRIMDVNK